MKACIANIQDSHVLLKRELFIRDLHSPFILQYTRRNIGILLSLCLLSVITEEFTNIILCYPHSGMRYIKG